MFCHNCGAKQDGLSRFCSNCGVQLKTEQQPENDIAKERVTAAEQTPEEAMHSEQAAVLEQQTSEMPAQQPVVPETPAQHTPAQPENTAFQGYVQAGGDAPAPQVQPPVPQQQGFGQAAAWQQPQPPGYAQPYVQSGMQPPLQFQGRGAYNPQPPAQQYGPPYPPGPGYGLEKPQKGSPIPIILLGVTAVSAFILFWLFSTQILGWAIGAGAAIVFLVLQLIAVKKTVGRIVMWLIPMAVMAGVFFLTTDLGGGASVVSKGVRNNDLGNIINGQYFFDDGTYQYYSSFDSSCEAHIYRTAKSTGETISIFDGFGWSMVTYDGWLYFTGNEGTAVTATYNIFRVRPDGSNLQNLNSGYCFEMSFYKGWLYYVKGEGSSSKTYSICRSKPDGTGEETVAEDNSGFCVLFADKLYYLSGDSNLYRANPDGTESVKLIDAEIKYFVIGQGRILYVDGEYNICLADKDGKNSKVIRPTDGQNIPKINSSQDKIFYITYDKSGWNSSLYAYPYAVHSMGFDGTEDIQVFSSYSWGFYINILGDRLYVLDYAKDPVYKIQTAIAKIMDLDGDNLTELYR